MPSPGPLQHGGGLEHVKSRSAWARTGVRAFLPSSYLSQGSSGQARLGRSECATGVCRAASSPSEPRCCRTSDRSGPHPSGPRHTAGAGAFHAVAPGLWAEGAGCPTLATRRRLVSRLPRPSPGAVHEIAHPSRDGAAKPRDSPSQPGYRMEPSNGLLGRISMDSTFA